MVETRDLFAKHGLRCTRQRDEIYRALAASNAHPTAEELYDEVRQTAPGLSLATVYNTLEAFCRCGLCLRLPNAHASGPCRYDAETRQRVHVALDDGRVLDVPEDISARILGALSDEDIRELERRMGVTIDHVQLQMMGSRDPDAS